MKTHCFKCGYKLGEQYDLNDVISCMDGKMEHVVKVVKRCLKCREPNLVDEYLEEIFEISRKSP